MLISLVLAVLFLPLSNCQRVLAKDCPSTGSLKPLYVLVLVPFPDSRPGSGFDGGLSSLPGVRIAREEINNHSNLLEGYQVQLIEGNAEACSRLTSPEGLVNLVEYGIEEKCSPVVAIAGLLCSSHTVQLSRITKSSLLSLSAANSPVFELENKKFRHLWRFLGSASVYVDATMAIMDTFGWTRIGMMHSHGEIFFHDMARHFRTMIRSRMNLTLNFSFGVDGKQKRDSLEVIKLMKKNEVTIMVLFVNPEVATQFLCTAYDKGLVFPNYVFLFYSVTHTFLIKDGSCSSENVTAALRGHIVMFTQQGPDNSSVVLGTTGEKFSNFVSKYRKEIVQVKRDYIKSHGVQPQLFNSPLLATSLYDQLWALALAMNSSLPELQARNISIDSLEQHELTHMIENHLSNISFQGATGYVQFNSNRSVSTPVQLFVSFENEEIRQVGTYNPQYADEFHIDINSSALPGDRLPRQIILLPVSVTVVVYAVATGIALFTTVVLVLYLYYREHEEVKATSPYLSILVFVGCYLLCLAAILEATIVSFELAPKTFTVNVSISIFLIVNGIGLILLTIFITMFRIYHIFFSWMKDLGIAWKSCSMAFIVLLLSVLPNMLLLVLILIQPPKRKLYTLRTTPTMIYKLQSTVENLNYAALLSIYFGLFVTLILFFAFRTRKIKLPRFKDTKKVTLFVTVMGVCISLAAPLYISLGQSGHGHIASLILIAAILLISTTCLLTLYVPKLPPVISLGHYCRHKLPTTTRTTIIAW